MDLIDIRNKIKPKTIYEDLARELDPYKECPIASKKFLVDSYKNIKIVIAYTGNKVIKRDIKKLRANSVLWEDVYDFLVIPELNTKPLEIREFTYKKMLDDFETYKTDDSFFRDIINLYLKNEIIEQHYSKVKGMNPYLFLYVLKWLWIQEDLNYKFNHKHFNSPTRYKNTKTGVGRGKFFASLLLVKSGYFTAKDCIKITSLY